VENNSDLFYQEISDEISIIYSGYITNSESPYILAGENCIVQVGGIIKIFILSYKILCFYT